jgi:hypothetical protein
MAKHIYLAKASNDLVSHCRCEDGLIAFPGQLDCPWCGCGWLFSCLKCRKAFTFGKGIETDQSWESLARGDLFGRWNRIADDLEVQQWLNGMRELLDDVEPGQTYVSLDGHFIPADEAEVDIVGWHSHHRLAFVPQVAALQDPSIIDTMLAKRDYWESNRVLHDDADHESE